MFPVSELLGLAHVWPVVLPAGQVLAIALATALVLVLDLRRPGSSPADRLFWRGALIWLSASGLALAWLGAHAEGGGQMATEIWPTLVAILAFATLARMLAPRGAGFAKAMSCCVAVACLFVGAIMAWSVLDASVKLLRVVYDPVLYRIDFLLGLSPAYRLSDWLTAHAGARGAILIFYKYNLVCAMPVVFAEAFVTRKAAAGLTLQLFLSSFLVFPLFCILPAMAPAFYFGPAFPDHLPAAMALAAHAQPGAGASIRNTFPSLHAAWAMLMLLAVLDGPAWLTAIMFAYLAITFLATIGFGEHYVVDWLAALPLVVVVRGLCASGLQPWAPARCWALAAGACLLAGWLVVGRTAPWSLTAPWLLRGYALLSVMGPILLEYRLFGAERRASRQGHINGPCFEKRSGEKRPAASPGGKI